MKLTPSQRRVLEALDEGEWVPGWRIPHLMALSLPRYRVLPQQTVTLNALLRKGLVEVRVRNAGLLHEWRRTYAGMRAIGLMHCDLCDRYYHEENASECRGCGRIVCPECWDHDDQSKADGYCGQCGPFSPACTAAVERGEGQ